jgi:chromosome segregation ATPase
MTDIDKRPFTDEQLEALVHYDAARDNLNDLRRRLADAELRAMKAVSAEDVAQFAFETARRRADRLEAAMKQTFIEQLTARVPENLENSVEGLADVLVDEIAAGTLLDELDVSGHIEAWTEER